MTIDSPDQIEDAEFYCEHEVILKRFLEGESARNGTLQYRLCLNWIWFRKVSIVEDPSLDTINLKLVNAEPFQPVSRLLVMFVLVGAKP